VKIKTGIGRKKTKNFLYNNLILSDRFLSAKVRKLERPEVDCNSKIMLRRQPIKKLSFLIDEKEGMIFKKIEFIFLINFEISFKNLELAIDSFNYKISDLTIDVCNFLQKQHVSKDIEQMKWLKILVVCNTCLDLMFNNSIHSMLEYLSSQGSDILIEG